MSKRKVFALIEVAFVPVFVLAYVWWLKSIWYHSYSIGVVAVLVSVIVQNDFRWNYGRYLSGLSGVHFRHSMRLFFLPLLGVCLVTLAAHWSLGYWFSEDDWRYLGHNFMQYIGLALCQQILLNTHLARRLETVFENKSSHWSSFVVAIIFYATHYPNPVLMGAGFIGGYMSTQLFFRYRDIYSLWIFHMMIGGTLHICDYLMKIGPAYWSWK